MTRPLAFFALAAALGGCGSSARVESRYAASPVAIDADASDWTGAITPVKGRHGLALGVRNDSQNLYVAVVATDEALARQFARGGLTLWLDAGGGTAKTQGVRFPLGGAARAGGPPPGTERPAEAAQPAFDHLALLVSGATAEDVQPATGGPVEAAARLDGGQFVYEARVPLQGSGFAVGAQPGATIGVGLATPERGADRPQGERAGRRSGGPGGGRPGGPPPVGAQGRPGGGPPGDRPAGERPEPLVVWTRVALASR